MLAGLAENFGHQVGRAVDDLRMIGEIGRRADEAAQFHHPLDFVQIAVRGGLGLGDQVEAAQPGRLVAFVDVHVFAESALEPHLSVLNRDLAGRVAGEMKGTVVAADDVYTTPCDVYAPCAVGATLNRETIPRLACRIVAGSANNQLAEPQDAGRLHQRGILYAPDYVINAGGALAFGLMAKGETDEEVLRSRVVGLGPLLSGIFSEAAKDDDSPLDAAERRVRRVLTRPR